MSRSGHAHVAHAMSAAWGVTTIPFPFLPLALLFCTTLACMTPVEGCTITLVELDDGHSCLQSELVSLRLIHFYTTRVAGDCC